MDLKKDTGGLPSAGEMTFPAPTMKIEFDKSKKEYSYEELAVAMMVLWPATVARPEGTAVLALLTQLIPNQNVTVNLPSLCSAVELIIRSGHGDFYTDWEQLVVATRAIPILLKTEFKLLVDSVWGKFKAKELDDEEVDDLFNAVLKAGPKLAWDEQAFRYVSERISEGNVVPPIKMAKWKTVMGAAKQQKMLEQQALLRAPPRTMEIARVERVEGKVVLGQLDYKLDILRTVFDQGYLGGLKRTTYLAPFGSKEKPKVLHDPWMLMKLREVSKRTRTWVDDLVRGAGLTEAVERARAVHFRIAKGRLLLVESWRDILGVINKLKTDYPIKDHTYICLGGSPAPIMIAMEHLEPEARIFHLPVSGIKGGVDHWMKEIHTLWAQYGDAISAHFARYLPPLGAIHGNKLVIIDYTSTGTALAVGMVAVELYYKSLALKVSGSKVSGGLKPPEVLGFALITSFHSSPTLLKGTVRCDLGKSPLGIALEKQTLKGSGLRNLEKMEIGSLMTTPEQIPDTRLDVAGLMRILAQIQQQLAKKPLVKEL